MIYIIFTMLNHFIKAEETRNGYNTSEREKSIDKLNYYNVAICVILLASQLVIYIIIITLFFNQR